MTSPAPTPSPEPTPAPTPEPKPERPTITPEVQKLIDDAAKGARIEGEKAGKKAAEDAIAAKAEEDRIARENDEAVKRGEFDTVKANLEKDRDGHKKRADDAEAELKAIWDARQKEMDEGLKTLDKDLPDHKYDPGPEAPIADRWKWFQKARETDAAAKSESAEKLRGYPRTPPPNTTIKPTDEEAKQAQARTYRDF